jgi:CheY-like chemotaxis protein
MKRVPPPSPGVAEPSSARPRQLVLYVEDDEDNRQVASFRLSKRYELVCAATDREACELLEQRGREVAIILMDIELKGGRLTGVELARLVRGRLDRADLPAYAQRVPVLETPILFVTAYGDKYRRPELLGAGGDEVIAKPVDFVALHTAMTRVYLQRIAT